MRRLFWFFPAVVIQAAVATGPATDTNVVASAGDAFGITLGPESIGLYGPSSVRGFSPIAAGNIRIDGLYFDLHGGMIDALATDTRIRVGLTATRFPWPAPSGVVDYTLREAGATPQLTSIIYVGPYDSRDIDVDGSAEFLDGQLGISTGGSYHRDEVDAAQTAHTASWGILSKWRPNSHISISTFWGRQSTTDAKPQATLYVEPGQTAPPISPRYYGPSWTNSDGTSEHFGMLVTADLSAHWSLRFGLFHSTLNQPISYFDLYFNTTSYGIGDHDLVVEPTQHYGSGSGDFQLTHKVTEGSWRQELILGLRGRSVRARYGGAESFDFGVGPVAHPQYTQPSDYAFAPATSNRIHEYSGGASYSLGWLDRASFTAGLRRDTYANEVADPIVGSSRTSLHPWLHNLSMTFRPTKSLTLFSALTRGLEDSGNAPTEATNRGQVLPATRSSQQEIGAKYAPSASLSLLAGAFEVQKSYFALDGHVDFSNLGQERHRGLEVSVTADLVPELRLVAGALIMAPDVSATTTSEEIIGKLPIGQPRRLVQVCLDYSPTGLHALSFDAVYNYEGTRVASVDNRVRVSGFSTLDLGARYRFSLDHHPATLRMQVFDINNTFSWSIGNDGGLERGNGRRAWAFLIVDI
jgi:iron complex outermembrane receptor protein